MYMQVRMIIKHVAMECLQQIPSAAEDLFILNGQDALEMVNKVNHDDDAHDLILIMMMFCSFSHIPAS